MKYQLNYYYFIRSLFYSVLFYFHFKKTKSQTISNQLFSQFLVNFTHLCIIYVLYIYCMYCRICYFFSVWVTACQATDLNLKISILLEHSDVLYNYNGCFRGKFKGRKLYNFKVSLIGGEGARIPGIAREHCSRLAGRSSQGYDMLWAANPSPLHCTPNTIILN